ncbi:uncharacterized protein VICG_02110 [Vittaforma corneae ATCC 50505]|uniref:Uncharacterized protein n=1 Tax=Vittaforma corneae (strain ATCC 50505) TaxID=993615 RepID=L2GK03_VITCO|nr:uncharacterized protein VICG_02110 [Vittaforma corneae ATCC 50505]ELA40850.1 hypothetical protein VICG_02110 [Vittaforma corneae ATCC 50505]
MKTKSYMVLRAGCTLVIFAVVLASIAYMCFFILNNRILSIERSLAVGRKLTLHSFSISLVYLNVFAAMFNAYAFNLASKWLMWASMWFAIAVNSVGLFAILHMRYTGSSQTKFLLESTLFSTQGLIFTLQDAFGNTEALANKEMFLRCYEKILSWFIKFECFCIVGLSIVAFGAAVRQFMKVHVEEESPPVIMTATVAEPVSLRSNSNMIRVR